MKIQDAAKKVVETKSFHLIRPRKGELGEYDVKEGFTGSHKGWTILDLFTASAMVTVYNALNPDNQAKFHKIPLMKLVGFCFQNVK